MKYYLDTNTVIYFLKGTYPAVREHMKKIPAQSIVIPSVVRAEIEYGARKSTDYDATIRKYTEFLDVFCEEPFGHENVQTYGIIRAELESRGTPIGPNDLLIAATVLSDHGTLVTHNVKEFSRVYDLRIEDWTE